MDNKWDFNTNAISPGYFHGPLDSFLFHKTSPYPNENLQPEAELTKFPVHEEDPTMASQVFPLHHGSSANMLPFFPFCPPEVAGMNTEEDQQPATLKMDSNTVRMDFPQLAIHHTIVRNFMELQKWQVGQVSLLLEVHLKLEQLKATRSKLKSLKNEKSIILKVRRRLGLGDKTMRRQNTFLNTPTSAARNSSQNSSALWRPIEFPCSPSPTATSTATVTPTSTPTPEARVEPASSPIQASLVPALQNFLPRFVADAAALNGTTQQSATRSSPNIAQLPCDANNMVTIGPNGTKIPKKALEKINWSLKETYVTRKILMEVFDGDTLAFHNLTGKPSPAFLGCNKPLKGQLDPLKVADVISIVTKHLNITEKEVRQTITIKCADENKRMRNRLIKMLEDRRDK